MRINSNAFARLTLHSSPVLLWISRIMVSQKCLNWLYIPHSKRCLTSSGLILYGTYVAVRVLNCRYTEWDGFTKKHLHGDSCFPPSNSTTMYYRLKLLKFIWLRQPCSSTRGCLTCEVTNLKKLEIVQIFDQIEVNPLWWKKERSVVKWTRKNKHSFRDEKLINISWRVSIGVFVSNDTFLFIPPLFL